MIPIRPCLNGETPPQLDGFRSVAREVKDQILYAFPDAVSFFVYGSVARGNPTTSSDIDTITILENRDPFFAVEKRNGILVSKEFHPRRSYENIGDLTNRVYDAWILHDPYGFFEEKQRRVRESFYAKEAKERRIKNHLNNAKRALERSEFALRGDSPSVMLHLRACGEHLALALYDFVERSPSMRRLIQGLRDVEKELGQGKLYSEFAEFLGYENAPKEAIQEAAAGVRGLQNLLYSMPISAEFMGDKEILNPLLAEEYIAGSEELIEAGEEQASLFPCQLYESMVLFRRNPALKTFFQQHARDPASEAENPHYLQNLANFGFPQDLLVFHQKIFGVPSDAILNSRMQHARSACGRVSGITAG